MSGFFVNIFATTGNIEFVNSTQVNSTNWDNVSITESQISDLTHTVNETNRLQNITDYDCPASQFVNGFQLNGTVICGVDADSGASNIFDQVLNRSSNVTFNHVNTTTINATSWGNVSITESQISDLVHTVNETNRLQNITDYDCPASQFVNGFQLNGTVICGVDSDSGASNIFDQVLNRSSNVTFNHINTSTINATSWANVTITESQINDLVHTVNETNRLQNITDYDCPASQFVNGFQPNGTVICGADADSGASWELNLSAGVSDNLFPISDSTFNFGTISLRWLSGFFVNLFATTGNIQFVNSTQVNSTNWDNVTITESQVSDLIHTVNETNRFGNLSAYDCASGQLVIGVEANGTVTCAADADSAASNIFDQDLNISSNVQFANLTLSGNLTVGTSSLFVDAFNSLLGVGTFTPTDIFTVQGNSTFNGNLTITGGTGSSLIYYNGSGLVIEF